MEFADEVEYTSGRRHGHDPVRRLKPVLMKLHLTVIPQLQHFLARGRWFTPVVVGLLVGLEVFGRQAISDLHDTVGAVVLLLIVTAVALRHRANPIGWVDWLIGAVTLVAKALAIFKVDVGPDLRGTPWIPRRLPLGVYALLGLLMVWLAAATAVWWAAPEGWRPYVVPVSYLLYLGMWTLLWGLIITALAGGFYLPFQFITRLSGGAAPGEFRFTRTQLSFFAGYVLVTVGAAMFLPLWPMLAFGGLFLLGTIGLALASGRDVRAQLIWRAPGSRRVFAVPPTWALMALSAVAVLGLSAVVMSAAGGMVLGQAADVNTMPWTTIFGRWVAWVIPGMTLSAAGLVYLIWRNNPALPESPVVYVADVPDPVHSIVRDQVAPHGWDVRFYNPQATDVRVRLVPPADSQVLEFDPKWPLAVSFTDLENGLVYSRMERRGEIQWRRQFLRGLERLFREAKARPKRGGCGYWVAPHLWFVVGLTRDEMNSGDEEPTLLTEVIGPAYVDIFAPAVRRYLYLVLRSLQVDLIFVEDGVDFRKLSRVLRMLFEVFDKGSGKVRAEDTHFRGLTNVRVMFHEFDVDEPFRPSSKYPEPKFMPLGRLRVLHVFRDRGEEEELIEPPFEYDSSPAPHLIGA